MAQVASMNTWPETFKFAYPTKTVKLKKKSIAKASVTVEAHFTSHVFNNNWFVEENALKQLDVNKEIETDLDVPILQFLSHPYKDVKGPHSLQMFQNMRTSKEHMSRSAVAYFHLYSGTETGSERVGV